MKNKFNKFLIIGLVGCSAAFLADKIINNPSLDEYNKMISSVIQKEGLNVVPHINSNMFTESKATLKLSKEGSKNVKINLGAFSTTSLKIMAPISAFKADTKSLYDFIALHEYSHGEFNHMIFNEKKFFAIQIKEFTEKDNKKIEEGFKNYFKNKYNSFLNTNLHENFADGYASILMIRNFADKYSDEEIKNVISYRYNQVKNQNEIAFGAFGDLEHRTDLALKKILETPFNDIRSMSPEQAKEFGVKVASFATLQKFNDVYKKLVKNNFELEKSSQLALEKFEVQDMTESLLSLKKIRDSALATKVSSENNNKL